MTEKESFISFVQFFVETQFLPTLIETIEESHIIIEDGEEMTVKQAIDIMNAHIAMLCQTLRIANKEKESKEMCLTIDYNSPEIRKRAVAAIRAELGRTLQ